MVGRKKQVIYSSSSSSNGNSNSSGSSSSSADISTEEEDDSMSEMETEDEQPIRRPVRISLRKPVNPTASPTTVSIRSSSSSSTAAAAPSAGRTKKPAAVSQQPPPKQQSRDPKMLPFKNKHFKRKYGMPAGRRKTLKQLISDENFTFVPLSQPTYARMEAPPSLLPEKKYCDFTGFTAKYTDPRTGTRYSTAAFYRLLRELPDHAREELLALRSAHTILR